VIQKLKDKLTRRSKSRIVDFERIPSAVLIPIYKREGECYILFTQRTNTVRAHKGQISFPGGAYEERDKTLLNTALRESCEEIGLARKDIKVLGELDDFVTATSNFVISPFVAVIPWPYKFKPDPVEVDEIIEIPVSALLDKNSYSWEKVVDGGSIVDSHVYRYNEKFIWGATAEMLNQFLSIWTEFMDNTGR
jgi:8-oxo-dGTP pyrophosphatase MutT (NUDIX family)